jgi:hypothetical protein
MSTFLRQVFFIAGRDCFFLLFSPHLLRLVASWALEGADLSVCLAAAQEDFMGKLG